jgi:hypothetical protein
MVSSRSGSASLPNGGEESWRGTYGSEFKTVFSNPVLVTGITRGGFSEIKTLTSDYDHAIRGLMVMQPSGTRESVHDLTRKKRVGVEKECEVEGGTTWWVTGGGGARWMFASKNLPTFVL